MNKVQQSRVTHFINVQAKSASGCDKRRGWFKWRLVFMATAFLATALAGFDTHALIQQPVVETYYVPTPADDLNTYYVDGISDPVADSTKFFEYAWNQGTLNDVGNKQIKFIVSIVGRQDNTVIYYDQWENGYNTDITDLSEDLYNASTNPDGTQVWGDNDPSNGIPPGLTVDIIDNTTTIILDNEIDLPRFNDLSTTLYDGRDKYASTRTVVSTVLTWPLASTAEPNPDVGYKMGGATEVWDTNLWGTDFEIPVGESTIASGGDGVNDDIFNRSAVSIMAGPGGATVYVDANADGDFLDTPNDINGQVLAEGENAYTVGVQAGAKITAIGGDVQVHLLTGHNWGSRWESRFFAMLPTDKWGNDYYSPISTEDGNATNVFIYNPDDTSSINVAVEWLIPGTSTRTSTTINVPANTTVAWEVPDNDEVPGTVGGSRTITGQHYSSADPFYIISAIDADATQTGYDWGYALIEADSLLPYAQAGWAVLTFGGDSSQDGNPLWVMLATPCGGSPCSSPSKTVYVNLDGDSDTGPLTDPNGLKYDYSFTADPLVGYQVFDFSDDDQTGAMIYTIDGTPLQVVYGEDPNRANATFDIDLGWTIPPINVSALGDLIYIDFNDNGTHDDGEPGIPNVEITLTWPGGSLTTRTLADGSYLFPKLTPSINYTVTVNTATLPAGMTQTGDPDEVGVCSTCDSATSKMLNSGEFYLDADFGYIGAGSIGDQIFNDLNQDGMFDFGETGFDDVSVTLTYYGKDGIKGNDDDAVFIIVSELGGGYLGNNLPYGTYDAVLNTETQPPGTILTTPDSYIGIVLNGGSPDYLTADFGMYWPHVKPLYLSTPGQCLDRIDPVATGDTSTALSEEIGRDEPSDLNLNVIDLFEIEAFDNQDSSSIPSRLWSSDWIENDEEGVQSPTSGKIQVKAPVLEFDLSKNPAQYIERAFSASGANDLDLSFTIDTNELDSTDRMTVEVSSDGGSNWTVIDTLDGSEGTGLQTYSNLQSGPWNISLTSTMQLKFDVLQSDEDAKIKFDDVTLAYVIPAGSSPSSTGFDQCIAFTSDFTLTGGEDIDATAFITASQGNIPTGSGVAISAVLTDGTQTIATMSTATVTQLSTPAAFETSDGFESNNYTGGAGDWTSNWIENNEADGPNAGDMRILADGPGGNLVLRTNKRSEWMTRSVDLSGAVFADISFDFRRTEDIDAGKFALLRISGDGGVTWPISYQVTGLQQSVYQTVQIDITSLLGDGDDSDFVISLGGNSGGTGNTDKTVYWDNILFEYGPLETQYQVDWTTTLGSNVTVPSGEAIKLTITESLTPNSPFQIQYDSVEKPSLVSLPTETFIAIDSIEVYSAAYPSMTLPPQPEPGGVTRYIRTVISDPFGSGDIAFEDLTIVDPNGDVTVVTLGPSNVVATTAGTKTYEFEWAIPLNPEGVYDIYGTAKEGTEGLAVIETTDHEISNKFDVSGRVINDADGDGDLGERAGEAGIDNVTVTIYADANQDGIPDGPAIQTTTTGSGNNGAYSFTDLATGNYVIIETNLVAYTSTNDIDAPNDDKILLTLSTADVTEQDFLDSTNPQIAPISGRVINDVDGDGDLGERGSEAGITAVTVQLWTDPNGDGNPADGVLYDSTVTIANGVYSFLDVPPGNYVVVELNPSGYTSTNDTGGPNDDRIPVVRVGAIASINNDFLDSTTPVLGSIGDTIFWDKDKSGTPDTGEGIAAVEVFIDYNNNGVRDFNEPFAITDANGIYTIPDMPVGTFNVRVDTSTLPVGFTNTVDPDGTPNNQTSVTLTSGENNTTTDFGYEGTGRIGNEIFLDTIIENGVRDPGEGIANAVVYIDANHNGVRDPGEFFGTTDVNGVYIIDNLPPASYDVKVDTTTLPLDVLNTTDPDGVLDNQTTVVLATGQTYTDADWGYKPGGAITGTLWDDGSGDGIYVPGIEPGIPGIQVALFESDGTTPVLDGTGSPYVVTTDINGFYAFVELPAGVTYMVKVVTATLPSGAVNVVDPDSPFPNGDNQTLVALPGAGGTVANQDFGYVLPAVLNKQVSPLGAVDPGDTVTYTLTPAYSGSSLFSNLEVSDVIPTGSTYVGDSDTPEATISEPAGGGTGTLSWDLGSNTAKIDGSAPGTVQCPAAVTLSASQDGTNKNDGSIENNADIKTKNTGGGAVDKVGLVQFDVSGIPAGATINSASLRLNINTSRTQTDNVHRLLKSWTETSKTWITNLPVSATDYVAASLGSIDASTTGLKTVIVTTAIDNWVNGGAPNNGFVLVGTGTANGDVKYDSSESGSTLPELVISYSVPTASCSGTPTLNASQDGTNKNDGSIENNADIKTKNTGSGAVDKVGLVQFDLSAIPAGATINSASLRLNINTSRTQTDNVHRLLKSWTETSKTWTTNLPVSATDYVATSLGSIDASTTGLKTVNVVTAVDDWVNGGATNNGFLLVGTGTANGDVKYNSSENGSNVPELVVDWTLPAGPGGTSSLTATPTLVKNGDTVTITLTVSSTGVLNNITPATPTLNTLVGGASCDSITSVDTTVKSINPGPGSVNFTWTCTANDDTVAIASADLQATATAIDQYGQPANFSGATSNSVLMPAPLTFQVTANNPATTTELVNVGLLRDDNVFPVGVPSNVVRTPLRVSLDYGDLPDSGVGTGPGNYQTTLADNGPRHIFTPGSPYLGAALTDAESDGQPNATATGDDITGTADEDGVVFGPLVRGTTASITVTSSGTAVLNGWGDFNHDGVFQPGEMIVSNGPLLAGSKMFTFNVPPGAVLGDTAFRFRVTRTSGQGGDSPTGFSPNGEVEDYFAEVTLQPTLVTIESFGSYLHKKDVIVRWETSSEIGTVGFHLERFDDKLGYVRLNEHLLPNLITSVNGGAYYFKDNKARYDETYSYRLIEVTNNSGELVYGPWDIQANGTGKKIHGNFMSEPREEDAATILRYDIAEADNKKTKSKKDKAKKDKAKKVKISALKVLVREAGLQRVSVADLAVAFGEKEKKVKDLIKKGKLEVSHRGEQMATTRSNDSSELLFYAESIDSVFTRDNVYWISEGKGTKMESVSGGSAVADVSGTASYPSTTHAEVEMFASTILGGDADSDYYYWSVLTVNGPGGSNVSPPLPFASVESPAAAATGTACISVKLHGYNNDLAADVKDHTVWLRINSVDVGPEESWDGIQPYTYETCFEQDEVALLDGSNDIRLAGRNLGDVALSMVLINEYELTYQRHYKALDDSLLVSGDGNPVISVDGFSTDDIEVLELADVLNPRLVEDLTIESSIAGYRVSFVPAAAETQYLVQSRSKRLAPFEMFGVEESKLLDKNNKAVHLVISPELFEDSAQKLADYRDAKKFESMVVTLEDIYDSFNGGIANPHAVQDFLAYAADKWKEPPVYVALVGKGSLDHRDVQGLGGNMFPILQTNTPWGLYACDTCYGDLDGKGVSQFSIGRIPVMSAEEMDLYVQKLEAYENPDNPDVSDWAYDLLFSADNPDAAGEFDLDSDNLASLVEDFYTVEKAYIGPQSVADVHTALLTGFGSKGLVNWVGHGSYPSLAHEQVLVKDDVLAMNNGSRLPLFAALTCQAGRFEVPGVQSLSEALLLKDNGGAIAVYAPTGLSVNADAVILNEGLIRSMYLEGQLRIGDIAYDAQKFYMQHAYRRFMLDIYNVMGDPATILH